MTNMAGLVGLAKGKQVEDLLDKLEKNNLSKDGMTLTVSKWLTGTSRVGNIGRA